MDNYDVVVIGSGPGGYVAANRAGLAGLKTAVVERESLGGVCLNWGCIPTKALLKSAELFEELQQAENHGFQVTKIGFDAEKIVARSRKIAKKMNAGVRSLLNKYKVKTIMGEASFKDAHTLQISAQGQPPQTIKAKHIIVATGASPRCWADFPVDHHTVINYRDALALTKFPKQLLVIGAGAIGVEFTYYFSAFGVKVHLVEMQNQLLPNEDSEISSLLLKNFQKRDINCYLNTRISEFKATKNKVNCKLTPQNKTEKTISLQTDMALVAIGMQAHTKNMGLEKTAIKTDQQGFIPTDPHMRTSVPHIYAIGDVTGRQLLAHKASAEAEIAVKHISSSSASSSTPASHTPMSYDQIPACTYCQPQVASLGLTEKACQDKKISYQIGKFPYIASGKANAIGHTDGMVKLLFGKPHGQLLGAHLIGPDVTELLAELSLAMKLEATKEEILATIHAHPTLSESIFEATAVAYGVSANF